MKNPIPRMLVLDSFNEGWIEFEGNPSRILRGDTELEMVLREIAVG